MALFRDKLVHEVARRMKVCAQGLATAHLLARRGLGPIQSVAFRKTGNQWGGECYRDDGWQVLQVLAVDGALMRTADTQKLLAPPYPNARPHLP